MKFRCGGNYYIPDFTIGRREREEYYVLEEDSHLNRILDDMSSCFGQLMQQYPMIFQSDFISELVQKSNECAFLLGVDPKCCYHYFGEDCGIYQGISVEEFDQERKNDLFWIKSVRNQSSFCQIKVLSCYDKKNGCLIPKNVMEMKREEDKVIQESYAPKVLKRKKLDV